ncbi:MAG: nucleotide-binding protein [Microcystis aeruginosa LL13-03]|nr:nucleotide-binding protein [Microcystis aeruginosa LL13-03]
MQTTKRIVLDANILIRAVLGKKVRNTIERFVPSVQFFTPDLCYEDAQRYLPILFEKRNLKARDALDVLEKMTCLIQLVDSSLYGLYEQEAKQRIAARDVNDWSIVAVALMLDCPIWTEDADFFGAGIATWTSDRVHLYLD